MTPDGIWLCVLLFFSTVQLWAQEELSRFAFDHFQMGTRFQLAFYAEDSLQAQAAARAAFARVDSLNALLSDYLPDSELSRLSTKSGEKDWIPVSKDLYTVLTLGREIAVWSEGAFDPTIGPLSKLWRRAFRQGAFPDPTHIGQAKGKVGYTQLLVHSQEQKVRLLIPGMRLDLGGIAKGYAVDEAMEVLHQHGIDRALVDGGGDLSAGAPPPGKAGWQVAIEGDTLLTIARQALATSGDTYRFLEWNGKRYSHIIDPRSGLGVDHGLQVSVLAPNCTLADALASTLSVEPGLEVRLKCRFPAVDAIISKNNQ